jgi:acyl-CoA reductase-like NAD-dependent aldehyde dehydrogenase
MLQEQLETQPFLVGGQWVGGSGKPFESVNPATGKINRLVATAREQDVDAAVRNAAAAQADPAWRNMPPAHRAAILRRIAELIAANADALARRQMMENGKLLSECRAQAAAAAGIFHYFAGICETAPSEVAPSRGNHFAMVVYEPFGVVAAITPWNSPLTLESQKVAAALAAGNAVVLKPSEFTPTVGLEVARLALEAGLPPGLFNVVTGLGGTTGIPLVEHPLVRMISFTGGTATGRAIAKSAASRLVRVALELGGKSPHIVLEDADLDAAVEGVVNGIFSSSGQSCIAGSRLLVQESIRERFVERVVKRTNELLVGDPEDPQANVAPLSSFVHRDRVEDYVRSAVAKGGRILTGGRRPQDSELSHGAYYEPTIIDGLSNSARACREEIFGPVMSVLSFQNEADLVRKANDTNYGLACGIWTRDYKAAWRIGRAIEAGTVWINTYKDLSVSVPFGGFKDSGIGREKGFYGLRTYQEAKTLLFGL